jgi:hypothetical protein
MAAFQIEGGRALKIPVGNASLPRRVQVQASGNGVVMSAHPQQSQQAIRRE